MPKKLIKTNLTGEGLKCVKCELYHNGKCMSSGGTRFFIVDGEFQCLDCASEKYPHLREE